MYLRSSPYLFVLLLTTSLSLSFAEVSPDVLKVTAGEGHNIRPTLTVDLEGKIWLAWQRNENGNWVICTKYHDKDGWSPEAVIVDYGLEDIFFDIAANETGEIWLGWSSVVCDDVCATINGATYYLNEEWVEVTPDTLYDLPSWNEIEVFFNSDGSPQILLPFYGSLKTCDLRTGLYSTLITYPRGYSFFLGIKNIHVAQLTPGKVWIMFDGEHDISSSGGWKSMPIVANFFAEQRWHALVIDGGEGISNVWGCIWLYKYASGRAIGADRKRVYAIYASDEHPINSEEEGVIKHEIHARLIVKCFDAVTGHLLTQWCLGDDAEVAVTDNSNVMGFALNRKGDVSVRALVYPAWYKEVTLEGSLDIASTHPSAVVDSLGNIWVAWDDGGDIYVSSVNISDMEVDDTLTSVELDTEGEVIRAIGISLSQNYPNPFNTSTIIPFTIPLSLTTAELAIYNLLGERIRTLVDGEVKSGEHRVTWDGKDNLGRDVSSGVYFYRLTVDGGKCMEISKMVLIR